MLKKSLLTAVVLGLSTTAVQANEFFGHELSGYINASVGQAKAEKPKPVKHEQNDWKEWGQGASSDRTDTAYKITLGVSINPYLAVEAQYIDLGKSKYKGRDFGTDDYGSWSDIEKVNFETSGLGMNLVGVYPIEDFTLFAKAGYHYLKTKGSYKYNATDVYLGDIDNYSESSSKTVRKWAPSFGVGASYNITPEFAVVAEYERFHKVANKNINVYDEKSNFKHNIDFASVGLRYSF